MSRPQNPSLHSLPPQKRKRNAGSLVIQMEQPPDPPSSVLHPIHKIPPTLSLTKHFTDPDRKTFSRLIQFHTGHAHIREYYKRLIRTEDPTCGCSRMTQTRLHILRDCPGYINQ